MKAGVTVLVGASPATVREARLQPLALFADPFVTEVQEQHEIQELEPELDVDPLDVEPFESDVLPEHDFEDPMSPVRVPANLRWIVERIENRVPELAELPVATEQAVDSPVVSEAEAVPAVYVLGTPPPYPSLSVRRGEEGTVVCRMHVGANGCVESVDVVESSGHVRLDEAAVKALLEWRFEPRREGGIAVPDTVLHPVVFRRS